MLIHFNCKALFKKENIPDIKFVQFHTDNPTGYRNMKKEFEKAKDNPKFNIGKISEDVLTVIDGVEYKQPYKYL